MICENGANQLIKMVKYLLTVTVQVNEMGRVWDGRLECRELKLKLLLNLSSNS